MVQSNKFIKWSQMKNLDQMIKNVVLYLMTKACILGNSNSVKNLEDVDNLAARSLFIKIRYVLKEFILPLPISLWASCRNYWVKF